MTFKNDLKELERSVKAGRVAHTGFLAPAEAAQLVSKLRQADVSVTVSGGFPGAKRRIVTVFPDSIPEATTAMSVVYADTVDNENALVVALRSHIEPQAIGDTVKHQDGCSVIVLEKARASLPDTIRLEGRTITLQDVPIEKVVSGSRKRHLVIVPSLRVDALGAKAFNISRSYFSKGIKAGNVTINGVKATKSSSAEPGDEIYAETIGRMYIASVQGETRRGNLKVFVDIEKG